MDPPLLTHTMLKIITRVRACDMVTCAEHSDNKAADQSSLRLYAAANLELVATCRRFRPGPEPRSCLHGKEVPDLLSNTTTSRRRPAGESWPAKVGTAGIASYSTFLYFALKTSFTDVLFHVFSKTFDKITNICRAIFLTRIKKKHSKFPGCAWVLEWDRCGIRRVSSFLLSCFLQEHHHNVLYLLCLIIIHPRTSVLVLLWCSMFTVHRCLLFCVSNARQLLKDLSTGV